MRLERRAGKRAFDLFADEEVFGVRVPIQELQAAVDAVVVGDRDHVHAARSRSGVDRFRLGVAIARAEDAQVPRITRMIRVDVEIRAQHAAHKGFSSRIWSTVDPARR